MPWFSYHGGHSGQFCTHAKGRLEDVVVAAIERGFTHYGLSEHCPRDLKAPLYPDEQHLGVAGLAQQFEAYMLEARRLQQKYSDRIELLVGFETERLPDPGWQARMLELRKTHAADFIIGSVHDVAGTWVDFSPEMTEQAAQAAGGRQALHVAYFDAVAALALALRPEIIGHLDLVRKFDGAGASFGPAAMKAAERALQAIASVGAVLDVNPGAARRGLSPVYPLPSLLRLAARMGVGVTLGDDGHGAHDVGVGLADCMDAIEAAGFRHVHFLARDGGQTRLQRAPLGHVRPATGRA